MLDDEREKRRSGSYEINPVSYKNHNLSPFYLSLAPLFPRFIMLFSLTLFHCTIVNVWKFVIGLYLLFTTYMSLIFSLLKCQRMPMVNREFTVFPYQCLNTVAN